MSPASSDLRKHFLASHIAQEAGVLPAPNDPPHAVLHDGVSAPEPGGGGQRVQRAQHPGGRRQQPGERPRADTGLPSLLQ